MAKLERRDELLGQLARLSFAVADAGIDLKQGDHGRIPV
jgi:hypothetical protein